MSEKNIALKLTDVEFRRRKRVILTKVNLEINKGEKWVLFGPNGIGKSSLVQMMSTRGFPSEGTVDILGNRLGKVDVFSYRNRIGLSSAELSRAFPPQEDPLDAIVTALTATTGRWRDTYTDEDYAKARSLMREFGIEYLEGKMMFKLSEGERTRVLICRALMADPDLLILDEPTTGLDLGGREIALRALSRVGAEQSDRAVVLVTHRLEEIPQGFDHVAIMGRITGSEADADADNVAGNDPAPGTLVYTGDLEHGFTSARLSEVFGLKLEVTHANGRWNAYALELTLCIAETCCSMNSARQASLDRAVAMMKSILGMKERLMRRGPLMAGEKVQFTDRRSNKITDQLVPGGVTQTSHGIILHDDVIGQLEGSVVVTVSAKRETQINQDHPERDANKPWKGTRAIGGWQFAVMRPRLADYVLSMPRGAQIMYPKDIAQVIQLGDIRSGMNVLESGAGSGAMSINLLDAVSESGRLTTIEMRSEFARVAEANATVYFGGRPAWWDLKTGDFDSVAAALPEHSFDRIMLDMLDPWNRLEQAYRVIAPGGVLVAYVTTTTQLSRMAEALREAGCWTEPDIQETLERDWKAQGLAIRPDHQMIGHTGFLMVSRAMAPGFQALRKRDRATKDTTTDIDSLSAEERAEQLEDLELRDISDRKLRKVLRDLDAQVEAIGD